jgi:2'-5' RNA ligase
MAYAISLLLDEPSASVIRRYWSVLAEAGVSRSMLDLAYPPHVTLRVHDELDAGAAAQKIDSTLAPVQNLEFSFEGLGTFEAEGAVLHALAAATSELLAVHDAIASAVSEPCRPHYEIGQWVPHCTLATDLNARALSRVRALIEPHWHKLSGRFEAIELVRFHPIERLWRQPLSPVRGPIRLT